MYFIKIANAKIVRNSLNNKRTIMHTKLIIEDLEKRLKTNPKSLLFARLADLYLKADRKEEAIQLCEEGVKNHPSYITGHFWQNRIMKKLKVLLKMSYHMTVSF